MRLPSRNAPCIVRRPVKIRKDERSHLTNHLLQLRLRLPAEAAAVPAAAAAAAAAIAAEGISRPQEPNSSSKLTDSETCAVETSAVETSVDGKSDSHCRCHCLPA